MDSVQIYRDVLPDWTRLRTFDEDEAEAVGELLVALVHLRTEGHDEPSYEQLRGAWLDALVGCEQTERAALRAHFDASFSRIANLHDHPNALGILLASCCSRLRSPITQFHAMSLLMTTVFLGGPDERQVEMCYRIGKKFGMADDRVEELFARMWTSFSSARAQRNGLDAAREYVENTHWRRNPALFRCSNPFDQRPDQ